ncbi:hypothetical protein [Sporomusa acidovorans]
MRQLLTVCTVVNHFGNLVQLQPADTKLEKGKKNAGKTVLEAWRQE